MGDPFGSWIPQQLFDWKSPNLDYLGSQCFQSGQQDHIPSHMNSSIPMVSPNGNLGTHPFQELPHSRVHGQTNEHDSWFYGLPHFRQAIMPDLDSVLPRERLYSGPKSMINPIAESDSGGQKRFLVFDQSGDKTTLIFSSGVVPPAPCLTSWSPKPIVASKLNNECPVSKEPLNLQLNLVSTENDHDCAGLESEMPEDTEELNALLYSDGDSDCSDDDDDEVTSTDHSPSTMTAHNSPRGLLNSSKAEVVASSDGSSTRKRKLFDGAHSDDKPSRVDTASSVKVDIKVSEYEDDAESRCFDGMDSASSENPGCEFGNKRLRIEKIRETVNVLQNLIPGGKSRDAVVVLDEAIHYLKSLKVKAEALGLTGLAGEW
ncbi:unnamed protein product [Linum trigynum]|uniref:BHLH domain-containing protein n=2 Tax=Linum trigynum TaxID=586398 RepID=A0AAV2EW08_9ROSI